MADFTEIIQEINTNLPDNTTQSITAAKLRTTLIDLTNTIDNEQDDFESSVQDDFATLQGQVETALDNLIVDNLTSESTTSALSANQGRVLNEKIDTIEYPEYVQLNLDNYTIQSGNSIRWGGGNPGIWIDSNTFTYNKYILIPVSPYTKVTVKSPNTSSTSQVAFLKSDTVEVGELADYASGWTNASIVASGGTEANYIAPSDAVYLYVLYQQNDNNTGTSVNNRKPQWVKFSTPLPYVKDSDIVNNFDSTDEDKVLSAALGPQIKPVVDSVNSPTYISVFGGYYLRGVNMGTSSAEPPYSWIYESGVRYSSVVPVHGIKKIRVTANAHSSHIAFLKTFEIPSNDIENLNGTLPDFAGNYTSYLLISSNTVRDLTVPDDCNFIYFNLQNTSVPQSYIPIEVLVLEQDEDVQVTVPSWFDNYDYESYVEENIYEMYIRSEYYKEKRYRIDHNAEYCFIGYGPYNFGATMYFLITYDASNNVVRQIENWGNGTTKNIDMQPITFQDNEVWVRMFYLYHYNSTSKNYEGKGALMRKIKNDTWIPTNDIIYCVSKVKSPVMPYNYSASGTTAFEQTDIWSAWAFLMPYNYTRNLYTNKKFPICAFFHGSSAFVSPDVFGWGSNEDSTSTIGKLRKLGYVVFDVNGYGINYGPSDTSRHWGNPRTVSTVKKAYEILVERFNCRRGMALSGISMGGALAKSYALTYPEDVVCCALEAPSELGGTARYNNPKTSSYQSAGSCARAWGYGLGLSDQNSANEMFNDTSHAPFYGYSISIAPIQIDEETNALSKIDMSAYTKSTTPELMFGMNGEESIEGNTNYKNFMQPFPVETKIWQGDADEQLPLRWNEMFVETARNAGSNVTLRVCPGCMHSLNQYPWVVEEILNFINDKMNI